MPTPSRRTSRDGGATGSRRGEELCLRQGKFGPFFTFSQYVPCSKVKSEYVLHGSTYTVRTYSYSALLYVNAHVYDMHDSKQSSCLFPLSPRPPPPGSPCCLRSTPRAAPVPSSCATSRPGSQASTTHRSRSEKDTCQKIFNDIGKETEVIALFTFPSIFFSLKKKTFKNFLFLNCTYIKQNSNDMCSL